MGTRTLGVTRPCPLRLVNRDPEKLAYYNPYLEPQTTIYKWLFQLDDSKSLHRKWLLHQTSIFKWLFGVPGIYLGNISSPIEPKHPRVK